MDADFYKVISDYSIYSKLLTIVDKDRNMVPFIFNNPQWRYHLFRSKVVSSGKPVRIIILKYRQGGFTTYEQGDSFRKATTLMNQEIVTVAHVKDAVTKIFQMVLLFYKNIPDEFKPTRKTDSSEKLEFPGLRSNFYVLSSGSDGIGVTLNKAHLSEFAFWLGDVEKQFVKLKETVPSTGEIIIESTPNGYNYFEQIWSGAKKGENAFFPFFIRWFDDPQYKFKIEPREVKEIISTLSTDEQLLVEKYQLTPEQLAWRRWKISEMNGNMKAFLEMYPENDIDCFLSSGNSFFDVEKIIKRAVAFSLENPPIFSDNEMGLNVWENPEPGCRYVVGADPSEGVGGDNSCMTIIEEQTGRMVLTLANNKTSAYYFAKIIYDYAKKYNDAFVVVESNNHGHTVLSELIHTYNYAKRHQLYHDNDYTERLRPKKYQIRKDVNKTRKPGFSSNKRTKVLLLDRYKEYIEETPELLLDEKGIEEAKTFVRHPDGKLGAYPGKHDDRVISHALAIWGMTEGRPSNSFSKHYQVY